MNHVFELPSMSCGHCKMRIEKALAASGAARSWAVDLEAKKASVESDQDRAAIAAVLKEAGYPPI